MKSANSVVKTIDGTGSAGVGARIGCIGRGVFPFGAIEDGVEISPTQL